MSNILVVPCVRCTPPGPICNLDLKKKPHAKVGLEHADPKDLVAVMRACEEDVMRLLGEVEALVNEVGP